MKVCLLLVLSLLTLNACQTHPNNSTLALNAATNSNRHAPITDAPPAPNSGIAPVNQSLDDDELLAGEDLSPEDEAE